MLAAGLLGLLALLAFAPRASTGGGYGHYNQRHGDTEYDYYDDNFGYKSRRSGPGLVDGELNMSLQNIELRSSLPFIKPATYYFSSNVFQ